MCGIIGYVGPRVACDVAMAGLKRMEYRGYDSAGVAVLTENTIEVRKKAGKIANLDAVLAQHPLPQAQVAIGHTRWATHGGPTDTNAHPHLSADRQVALIHNGIIENFAALRKALQEDGVAFTSVTDTEVVAHLLGREVAQGTDLAEAMRIVCRQLQGAFTLVAISARSQPAGRGPAQFTTGIGCRRA